MPYLKNGSPYLFDDVTDAIVGIRNNGMDVLTKQFRPTRSPYTALRYVAMPSYAVYDTRSFRQIFQVPSPGGCLARAVVETDDIVAGLVSNVAMAAGRSISDVNPLDAAGNAATWKVCTPNTAYTAASATFASDGIFGQGKTNYVELDIPPAVDGGRGGYIYVGVQNNHTTRKCAVGNAGFPTSDYQQYVNARLPNLKYRAMHNSGADNVTVNQNSFTVLTDFSYFNPISAIEIIPAASIITGYVYTDSTGAGYGTGTPAVQPQGYSWGHIAANRISSQYPCHIYCGSGVGQGGVVYLERLNIQLADTLFRPTFVVIQPFSRNSTLDTATISTQITKALTLAASCAARGIVPIFTTVLGGGGLSAPQEAARLAGNAKVRVSGYACLDMAGLLGDKAAIESIIPAYTFDTVHLNIAGNELLGAALANLVLAL